MTNRTAVLGALLVITIAALIFAIVWQPSDGPEETSSSGLRVVVVGVDGLDWFILQQYVSEGRMPFLGHLIGRGVLGSIGADRPVIPTVGWTQLGNGRHLDESALAALGEMRGASAHTGTPAMVQAATAAGASCLTIGWPGSWPVDGNADAGMVVAPYTANAPAHQLSLAPAYLVGGTGQTAPADLATRLDETVRSGMDSWMTGFDEDILPAGETVEGWFENELAARWSYVSDRAAVELAAGMLAEFEPELALIHLGGLDAVSHRFVAPGMRHFFPNLPENAAVRYADVLPSYYEFVDSAIRRLHRLTDDRTVFVVCSAYGTHPAEGDVRISGSHERGAPGVLILSGRRIAPVPTPVELSTVDLAPTLLAVIGRPIPSDFDGRIVPQAMPAGFLQSYPPVYSSFTLQDPEPVPSATDEMEALTAAQGRFIAGQ